MRIVSLCPSNTEILCALGLQDALVGLDRSSDWPSEIVSLPRVGPDTEVDVQKIADLKPDIVFSSLSVPGMERNIEALEQAGLPQIVIDAQNIAGIYQSILTIGRATGKGIAAQALVAQLKARLHELEAENAQTQARPKVFLEWWPKPVITPGRRCWTTEMIVLAGGEPAFADLDVRSTPILPEAVLERNPDILLTCWCGVPHDKQKPLSMAKREGWDKLPAVQKGRMYAANEHFFGRPGPRIVEGIVWLHKHIQEVRDV